MLPKDEKGRLWSEELESWLMVEPEGLRLYTAGNVLRLTEAEAGWQRADKLAEMLRKLGHNPDDLI